MELVANRSVVEHELRQALGSRRANQDNSVLLLRAAPEWRGELQFSFEDKDRQIGSRWRSARPCSPSSTRSGQPGLTTALVVLTATPARSGTPCSPRRCNRRSSRSTAGTW